MSTIDGFHRFRETSIDRCLTDFIILLLFSCPSSSCYSFHSFIDRRFSIKKSNFDERHLQDNHVSMREAERMKGWHCSMMRKLTRFLSLYSTSMEHAKTFTQHLILACSSSPDFSFLLFSILRRSFSSLVNIDSFSSSFGHIFRFILSGGNIRWIEIFISFHRVTNGKTLFLSFSPHFSSLALAPVLVRSLAVSLCVSFSPSFDGKHRCE